MREPVCLFFTYMYMYTENKDSDQLTSVQADHPFVFYACLVD